MSNIPQEGAKLRSDPGLPVDHLKDVFRRFSVASNKLEERHLVLVSEITELKQKLAAKDLEIARAARLAMLGETAAAIAHEVRNPLGAMRLFLSLLRDEVKENGSATKLVDQLDTGIASLDHAVSNILHFSSDKPLTLAPVNLHAIIQDQTKQYSTMLQSSGLIISDLKSLGFVAGDEHALRQVIGNLLRNALQATRFQGTIVVSTRDLATDLILEIRDNGPGISAELLDSLFEPFVTGRNEGTGLGLAIVKRIILQHRATIRAYNNDGAVFEVSFPITSKR